VQHRGGLPGFIKVLDPHTLAFADLRGNRQYISVGNTGRDDRVALIFVDYPNRARLKVLAHARIVTRADDPALFARVAGDAPAERVFVLGVEGFDWNCPQHITPRFTEQELERVLAPVRARLAALEAENRELRKRLGMDEGIP
jgi:predicted pyridoxine 5'-phosphate oxidase superfamily flavin-nucleotide-binding protein